MLRQAFGTRSSSPARTPSARRRLPLCGGRETYGDTAKDRQQPRHREPDCIDWVWNRIGKWADERPARSAFVPQKSHRHPQPPAPRRRSTFSLSSRDMRRARAPSRNADADSRWRVLRAPASIWVLPQTAAAEQHDPFSAQCAGDHPLGPRAACQKDALAVTCRWAG